MQRKKVSNEAPWPEVDVEEYLLQKVCLQIISILFEMQTTSEIVNTWGALPTLQLNTVGYFGWWGSEYKSNLAQI